VVVAAVPRLNDIKTVIAARTAAIVRTVFFIAPPRNYGASRLL
jgi:hypothetical protein